MWAGSAYRWIVYEEVGKTVGFDNTTFRSEGTFLSLIYKTLPYIFIFNT